MAKTAEETTMKDTSPKEGTLAYYMANPKAMKTVNVPYSPNDNSGDIYVAVGGKTYQVQRGATITVPFYVARVLEQSLVQDRRAIDRINGLGK